MKLNQIITHLTDTDQYKFSMGQAIFHQFNSDITTWSFKCRNKDVYFTPEMTDEIISQIKAYCTLKFTEEELTYLSTIKWLKKDYIDFLRFWHPRFEEFTITRNAECGLSIETKGTWFSTSMYEIPVLAIVNEVYFTMKYDIDKLEKEAHLRTNNKIASIILTRRENPFFTGDAVFSEFGTRRRLSRKSQEKMIANFAESNIKGFVGTSNVYFARKYGIKPVGTMAHEYIMTVGQGHHEYNPAYSNKFALDSWIKEYGILNGIALTDTITTDCFLKDFRLTFATLFSGVRHDSGDPIEWGEKMIKHYESLGIDPNTKTLLFSDSLDFDRAYDIYNHFKNRAKIAFGIGTWLSNDCGETPLNIVMKVTEANGQPVAKISDASGKCMCKDESYVDYLTRAIDWRMTH